ncbi:MAG TPA: hypothetical protein VH370_06715 [Humisphaera sp.]|jgi:hypothetical protein|nr:hypothetical protein [Humisphaera sp.]
MQSTRVLILLLLLSAAAAIVAYVNLTNSRDAAIASQRDLNICRADLADLSRWQATPGAAATSSGDDRAFNKDIRIAAIAAGIPNELASVEVGQPVRFEESDYLEMPLFLRLNAVTLRQLTTFIHDLSDNDPRLRAKMIELSVPTDIGSQPNRAARAAQGESWTADLTLARLSYAPKPRGNP